MVQEKTLALQTEGQLVQVQRGPWQERTMHLSSCKSTRRLSRSSGGAQSTPCCWGARDAHPSTWPPQSLKARRAKSSCYQKSQRFTEKAPGSTLEAALQWVSNCRGAVEGMAEPRSAPQALCTASLVGSPKTLKQFILIKSDGRPQTQEGTEEIH